MEIREGRAYFLLEEREREREREEFRELFEDEKRKKKKEKKVHDPVKPSQKSLSIDRVLKLT
jgi:hypothetical protein